MALTVAAPDNKTGVVGVAGLRATVTGLFVASGLSPSAAERMAAALVEADQQGVGSHGVAMAPMYLERLALNSVTTSEAAGVISDSAAMAVLDAGHMLGHLAADQAMAMAIDKASRFGLGAVAVRHGFHFGVAGRYAAQAARAGCIGVAMCNTKPMMAAPGGRTPLVGNNPLAIAAPAASGPPILLDMAMSEVALARVRAAARRGETIPPTWAVGPDGAPTTDPQAAIAGMLAPMGGGKGFALALMVDVLCGMLSGGAWGAQVKPLFGDLAQPNDCAFLFIAIDVGHFRPLADFLADADRLRAGIEAAPTVSGAPGFAPGDERAALQAGQQDHVTVDPLVLDQLRQLARARGVDPAGLAPAL